MTTGWREFRDVATRARLGSNDPLKGRSILVLGETLLVFLKFSRSQILKTQRNQKKLVSI